MELGWLVKVFKETYSPFPSQGVGRWFYSRFNTLKGRHHDPTGRCPFREPSKYVSGRGSLGHYLFRSWSLGYQDITLFLP